MILYLRGVSNLQGVNDEERKKEREGEKWEKVIQEKRWLGADLLGLE